MGEPEKFWAEDPCALATRLELFPTAPMSKNRKLNALTRLAAVLALVMALLKQPHAGTFLLAALLVVVLLKFAPCGKSDGGDGQGSTPIEEFTRTPTYVNSDFHQTIVSPTYAEEWQIPPPAYDIYDSYPVPEPPVEPLKPQSYPYGQYRTVTNELVPADSYVVDQMCGGAQPAREMANDYWTRQSLAFRDNMTRLFKLKLNRRFRQNCASTWDSFSSY